MFNCEPIRKQTTEKTQQVFETLRPIVPATTYSNLKLEECFEDEYNTITAVIYGGLNGKGSWSGYLIDLANLLAVLEKEFEDAYIIYIDNDCVDDVFTAHIGIKPKS